MNDSPVFIVGCPRSGTSLLRNLLRSHPHLTFPDESYFIPQFYEAYGDPHNEREAVEIAAQILRVRWVQAWGLSLEPSAFAHDRSYAQIARRVYAAWAEKENRPRWGDKTPRYVLKIPLLLKIFPAAKILHIYRDGRDVALSWLRVGFGPRNLFTAARSWKTMVGAGLHAGAALPRETYFQVRYETLLSDPTGAMKEVCAFLDEPFTDAVLRPTVGSESPHGHARFIGHARPRPNRPSEIVAANMEKWKTQMSSSDKILFESIAGDLLETLGYETEGVTRRITRPERWMWNAHHCLLWVLRRLNQKGYYKEVKDALVKRWAVARHRLRV